MQRSLIGETTCGEILIHYYLLDEDAGPCRRYGILIEYGSDRFELRDLTSTAGRVRSLLQAMCRGAVTPVTARDVVEDWLLE